ncbi:Unknown protein [Striga hermonthica]|uniref:F-box domain-containing protein n=1 Tax=Striga hermonthica TaxID=68872 RepID=A0A9N7MPW4_STRHE|nr:Unknown protein [Striga hermonthica]
MASLTSTKPLGFSTWFTLLAYQVSVFALSYRISSSFLLTRRRRRRRRRSIDVLPDAILISILDRLPFKDAVRTCVLSRRWASLHKSVIHLDLRCHHLVCRPYSRTWIHLLLQRYLFQDRDDYHPEPIGFFRSQMVAWIALKYFRTRKGSEISSLIFCCCLSQSYMIRLQHFVSAHLGSVRKLAVQCCCEYKNLCSRPFSCTHHLPETRCLTHLELENTTLNPNSASGSLRILRLSRVELAEGSLECLLSGCMALRALRMDYCRYPPGSSTLRFCGPHLRLECLVIEMCAGVREIKFHAASLVSIEFHNREPVRFVFHHVPRLQNLHIHMHCVLERLPFVLLPGQLRSLTVGSAYDIDMIQVVPLDAPANTFSNLRRLMLKLGCTAYKDMIFGMISFLNICPVLHEFRLDTEFVDDDGLKMKMPSSDTLIHTELKKVEINGFCGTINEIEFASFILENATSLEQMQINRCPRWDIGGNQKCPKWDIARNQWWIHKPEWSEETRQKILKLVQGAKNFQERTSDYSTYSSLW